MDRQTARCGKGEWRSCRAMRRDAKAGFAPNASRGRRLTLRAARATALAFALCALVEVANAAPAMAGNRIAVEPSGDVIEVGGAFNVHAFSFNVARYLPDGSLDPSFGADGIVTLKVPKPCTASATAPTVDSRGRILVVGFGRCSGQLPAPPFGRRSLLLARFRPDGRLDKSFAHHGLATKPNATGDAVAIGPSGRIVVSGAPHDGGVFVLARYLRNGAPDPTFRVGNPPVAPGPPPGMDLALTPRGGIVVGGTYSNCEKVGCGVAPGIARFRANGEVDTSFGKYGVVSSDLPTNVSAIALDSSGRIVVVGSTGPGASSPDEFGIERLLPDGTLDSGFGSGGVVITRFDSCTEASASSVAIDNSGDLVVGGFCAVDPGPLEPVLARYTSDGALDPGFGSGGTVMTHFAFGNGGAFSGIGLGPADKITAGALSTPAGTNRAAFLLARYTSAGSLDSGFGSGGTVTTPLPGP
jgi:uncharacterized delta-60 repeat protein